jgi:hypothetical protein
MAVGGLPPGADDRVGVALPLSPTTRRTRTAGCFGPRLAARHGPEVSPATAVVALGVVIPCRKQHAVGLPQARCTVCCCPPVHVLCAIFLRSQKTISRIRCAAPKVRRQHSCTQRLRDLRNSFLRPPLARNPRARNVPPAPADVTRARDSGGRPFLLSGTVRRNRCARENREALRDAAGLLTCFQAPGLLVPKFQLGHEWEAGVSERVVQH